VAAHNPEKAETRQVRKRVRAPVRARYFSFAFRRGFQGWRATQSTGFDVEQTLPSNVVRDEVQPQQANSQSQVVLRRTAD
jgi:hypothetical protein